jgi:DNA-binding transcriptional LysR family regulator
MDIKTEHMREFLVLSEYCDYTEAAERLFISASALFKHIKMLEGAIDAPLFERSGRRIVLSEYGNMFIPYAREILKNLDKFSQEAELRRDEVSSIVLVGTQYRITDLVADFRAENDKYILRVFEGGEPEQFFNDENCELAFVCNLSDPEEKYVSIPYMTDNLAVIMHLSHPFVRRESVSLADLRKERFVAITPQNDSSDFALDLCRDAGFSPKVVMTARTGNEVARLAAQGLGIALLYKNIIMSTVREKVFAVDICPLIEKKVSLCYRKDKPLSAGARAFVEYVKSLSL